MGSARTRKMISVFDLEGTGAKLRQIESAITPDLRYPQEQNFWAPAQQFLTDFIQLGNNGARQSDGSITAFLQAWRPSCQGFCEWFDGSFVGFPDRVRRGDDAASRSLATKHSAVANATPRRRIFWSGGNSDASLQAFG